MMVVGVLLLRRKGDERRARISAEPAPPTRRDLLRLVAAALTDGTLSGFFWIGGGFLIAPGLILSTGMPTICAIGSSLLAVAAFGVITALGYGSGLIDWTVAAEYHAGGLAGG
jgi:uncharacterized membrane protein YfcA